VVTCTSVASTGGVGRQNSVFMYKPNLVNCYGFGILFHVTWSRVLARLAKAVWSGRTRVFVRTDPL